MVAGRSGGGDEDSGPGFATFWGQGAPGEDGGRDSVLGAAGVFVGGGVQFGENLDEFALGSGSEACTQFTNAVFDAS